MQGTSSRAPIVDQTKGITSSNSEEANEAENQSIRSGLDSELHSAREDELVVQRGENELVRVRKEKDTLVQSAVDELRDVEKQQEACLVRAKKALEEMHKEREECVKAAREDLQQIQVDGKACLEKTKEAVAREEKLLREHQCKMEMLNEEGGDNLDKVREYWEEKLFTLQESFRQTKKARENELEIEAGELERELRARQAEEIERVKENTAREFEEQRQGLVRELDEGMAAKMAALEQELKVNSQKALLTHKDMSAVVIGHSESIKEDEYGTNISLEGRKIVKESGFISDSHQTWEGQGPMQIQIEAKLKHELDLYKAKLSRELQDQQLTLVQSCEDMQVGTHS